jgi:hypothetical protein
MATTLSASRAVTGDPAVVALLMTGPEAANFLPQTTLTSILPGELSGMIELSGEEARRMHVTSAAPRRTPTAYIATFSVEIDGLPPTTGALHVMSAGPGESRVDFSLTSADTIPAELEAMFEVIVTGFFDALERAAQEQTRAA